jgi:hypothetical protein
MLTGRTVVSISLLCAVVACKGDPGTPGDQGPPGEAGTTPSTTGTLAGKVSDGVANDALAGVAVTAADAGGATIATTTTGADGKFAITIAAGPVDLSFAKANYTSPGVLHSGVGIGQTVTLAVTMNESASGKPSISLAAPTDDTGYGAAVALVATASDPNGDALAYAWANTTWPVLGSITGSGANATFTMPTIGEAFAFRPDSQNPGQFIHGYVIEDRFGILPIITDTRGQVTAKVTVDDGRGQSASASLTFNAASVTDPVRNVPVGQRIYVNSGHDTANAWTLAGPTGSQAAFDDATSRTPSFVVDRVGEYTVSEGGHSLVVTVGTWRGAIAGGSGDTVTIDSECKLCHQGTFQNKPPDMFTPWQGTGHATMFTRGINGDISPYYSGDCIGCHTVGFDNGVSSGGFDDVARAAGWAMPATFDANNWTNMVETAPSVAKLANVQCESCHGPQSSDAHMGTWDANQVSQPFSSPRISYAAESCATCHGAGAHHIYSEWATLSDDGMGHANRTAAMTLGSGATGLNSSCGRCHTAQGYTLYADLLQQGKVALTSVPAATLAQVTPANAEPVTCVACHDPHDATNPNQLRFFGDTPNLPGGFAGHGMGKGAVCVTCHNSRNGAQTGSDALTYLHEDGEPYNGGNPTSYSAPHQADQSDVFLGHNAYFMGASMPMLSKHAAITDTCVGCHMTLQPRSFLSFGQSKASGHLFGILETDIPKLCANCHGTTVDGEGIQAQVEAQLAALSARAASSLKAKVAAVGGVLHVRAYDAATDFYTSTSASNFVVDTTANPIVSASFVEVHGQVSLDITFTNAMTVPYIDTTGAPQPKTTNELAVQLGALKDNQATPAVLYALTGNFVRAGWNYFLIEGDGSKGLHNPSFALAVLNASVAKDLSN